MENNNMMTFEMTRGQANGLMIYAVVGVVAINVAVYKVSVWAVGKGIDKLHELADRKRNTEEEEA